MCQIDHIFSTKLHHACLPGNATRIWISELYQKKRQAAFSWG
jgi:hypothetical protein